MEAHGLGLVGTMDRVKQGLMMESDRPNALRGAIMCCRSGGTTRAAGQRVNGQLVRAIPTFCLGIRRRSRGEGAEHHGNEYNKDEGRFLIHRSLVLLLSISKVKRVKCLVLYSSQPISTTSLKVTRDGAG